ncbi:hypothetical protein [Chitinophaga sp. YIM B06452]|uniref:hypothetical protein n=1 Tax=Chitinophaga sp. YIM B06452 TaxID=3082158 RepID=UPI0031FED087
MARNKPFSFHDAVRRSNVLNPSNIASVIKNETNCLKIIKGLSGILKLQKNATLNMIEAGGFINALNPASHCSTSVT